MADKKQDSVKKSAFSGVDTLFEDAAPKDAPKVAAAGEKKEDELATVALAALHAFPDHPYTVDENDNDMAELVDSIQREGLLERIVVQRRKEGGFEILSGHRRHRACTMLGISEVPVIIKNGLSKDQSILLMVDANLKRKNILPMDEAKALKMQMDAMNRMGKRSTHGKVKRTDEAIAEKINKNRMYVQRKVKLLELNPDLQEAVNDKTLSETPAVEIAYLPQEVQEFFYDWMIFEDRAPTVAQAISLRQHQQELTKNGKGKEQDRLLTEEQIDRIMNGERLAEIFPPPEPEKEAPAEKEDTAGPQASAASPEKEDSPAAPAGAAAQAGHIPAQGEQGGETQPPSASESKAIPFQPPSTQAPEPGRSSYNSSAPAPAPTPPQVSAEDAAKTYIRTEYMAELRKENVIVPKSDIEDYVSECYSNDDYVDAIKAALVAGAAKEVAAKAVENKGKSEKPAPVPTVSTPTTEIVNRVEAREAAEKAAKTAASQKMEKPPVSAPPKAPEPPKSEKPPVGAPPKTPEPPKSEKPPVGTPPKTPEPSKTEKPPVSAPPKTPEPPKMEKPTTPAKTEVAKKDEGTAALDDYLKNKPKPGKGKAPQAKTPNKLR